MFISTRSRIKCVLTLRTWLPMMCLGLITVGGSVNASPVLPTNTAPLLRNVLPLPGPYLVMSLTVLDPVVTQGQPIVIDIVVQNVSNVKSGLIETGPPTMDFDVTVKNARGYPVGVTAYGKPFAYSDVADRDSFSGAIVSVGAGQTEHHYLHLNRYFDMSIGGTYTVMVQRKFLRQGGKGEVLEKAGPITLTLYPMSDQDLAKEVMGHAAPTR